MHSTVTVSLQRQNHEPQHSLHTLHMFMTWCLHTVCIKYSPHISVHAPTFWSLPIIGRSFIVPLDVIPTCTTIVTTEITIQ